MAEAFLLKDTLRARLAQPAASLPPLALEHGAALVEINPDETPLSPLTDQAIRDTAANALVILVSQFAAWKRDNGAWLSA